MIAARVWWVVFCSALSFVGGACGGGSPSPSANPQQNVMVVDEGIDLSVSALQGDVVATYTETCVMAPTSDAAVTPVAVDSGAFDVLKETYLQELAQTDDSCHLATGISSKPDPLAAVAQLKARWNQMVRENKTVDQVFTYAEYLQLMGPLNDQLMTFGYHGTATSSVVAHENPNVRLVLVERQLGQRSRLRPPSRAWCKRTSTRPSSCSTTPTSTPRPSPSQPRSTPSSPPRCRSTTSAW